MSLRFLFVAGLVVLASGLRLIEHPWNIAPMGALALFAGAHLRDKRYAFAVPLIALLLGDIALGAMHRDFEFWTFHAFTPIVALCYVISVSLGLAVQRTWKTIDDRRQPESTEMHSESTETGRKLLKAVPVVVATAAGGTIFYLVTNFAVWALFPTYPHTAYGLVECYELALPFFRNTLLSDGFYVAAMFGAYSVLRPVLDPSEGREFGADHW